MVSEGATTRLLAAKLAEHTKSRLVDVNVRGGDQVENFKAALTVAVF
jgi:hypothetical protein